MQLKLAFTAQAINVQTIILRRKTRDFQVSHIRFQRTVSQLPDGPASRTNQMQMRIGINPQLILHRLDGYLMTHHQTGINQYIQRIIECCLTDMEVVLLQPIRKHTHIKMTGKSTYFLEYSISLLGFPQFLLR